MLKIIYVLVMMNVHGGVSTDLTFSTMHQCNSAKAQVEELRLNYIRALCIEQQVKSKKLKCSIENSTDYVNKINRVYSSNMDHYPYPIGFNCVEE